jgi:hypothetical protein
LSKEFYTQPSFSGINKLALLWRPIKYKCSCMKTYLYFIAVAFATCIFSNTTAQQFTAESVVPRPSIEGNPRIYISPNPIRGNAYFYLQVDSCDLNTMDNVIIYNSSGYAIQSRPLQMQPGNNRFLINTSGFGPGYYVVRLVGKDVPGFSFSAQIQMN